MVGTSAEPILKAKGAETWGLVLWAIDALAAHETQLDPSCRDLRSAGSCLVEFMEVVHNHGVSMPQRIHERRRQGA